MSPWRERLLARLIGVQRDDGSWAYRPGRRGAAEPTALAALACRGAAGMQSACAAALGWLRSVQQSDGAVPAVAGIANTGWTTPLAAVAWMACGETQRVRDRYDENARRAIAWLLRSGGERVTQARAGFGHDGELVGWAWISGTHSWVEPTAQAVLALRAAGMAGHARAREGVRLLLDRAMPQGGWNYGNNVVFGKALRPFPATTGVALTALAGEPPEPRIAAALKFGADSLERTRAPLSLAWTAIGLRAWDTARPSIEAKLADAAGAIEGDVQPHCEALLLLAGQDARPLGFTHGRPPDE
jgi:hypothetical protein